MIYTYAINPDAVLEWGSRHAYRLIVHSFGLGTPRIFYEYPSSRKWKKRVLEAANDAREERTLEDGEFKNIEVLVQDIFGEPSRRRYQHEPYNDNQGWCVNVASLFASGGSHLPPEVVVGCDGAAETHLPTSSVGDRRNPLWEHPPSALTQRKTDEFVEALTPLLLHARNLIFVDPHFDPSQSRYQQPFQKIIDCLQQRPSWPVLFQIHCNSNNLETKGNHFRDSFRRALRLPRDASLQVFFLEEKSPRKEKLHDRFLLTDLGGVGFTTGLDIEDQGGSNESFQDIYILSQDSYEQRWENFMTRREHFFLLKEQLDLP